MNEPDPNAEERFDVAKTVMLVGFCSATAAALVILGTWGFVAIKGWPVDTSLREMALMALTYLTTTAGFAKTFVEKA